MRECFQGHLSLAAAGQLSGPHQTAAKCTVNDRAHTHRHSLSLTLTPEPGQGGGKEPGKESGARQEGNSRQEAQARGHHGQETQGANLCCPSGQSTAYPRPRC